MSAHTLQRSERGYPIGCTCAEYQRRVKAYRHPLPCKHMRDADRVWTAAQPPRPDPNRVRVDVATYYAAAYETTIAGVRYVGEVDEIGRVRLTAVEYAGRAEDCPLGELPDVSFEHARTNLRHQARMFAARGEVDILDLPNAVPWRADAITALVHAMNQRDRRAQAELQALRDGEAARAIAIAARCAGSEGL